MNIAKATIAFGEAPPTVKVDGQVKTFTEITVNGKTFQGIDLGNNTYAMAKRVDSAYAVKLFKSDGSSLEGITAKVQGGTVSRLKGTDQQKFAKTDGPVLNDEVVKFNSAFAQDFRTGAQIVPPKPRDSVPLPLDSPRLAPQQLRMDPLVNDDEVDGEVPQFGYVPLQSPRPVLLQTLTVPLDEADHEDPLEDSLQRDSSSMHIQTGSSHSTILSESSSLSHIDNDLDFFFSPQDDRDETEVSREVPHEISTTPELDKLMLDLNIDATHVAQSGGHEDLDKLIAELERVPKSAVN